MVSLACGLIHAGWRLAQAQRASRATGSQRIGAHLLKLVRTGILARMTTAFYLPAATAVRGALAALLAASAPMLAAQTGLAAPETRAPNAARARLARIDSLLERAVADSTITGAVGLVLRDGKVLYERAVGWADKESGRRMAT